MTGSDSRKKRGVRGILLMGVFWRILFIEAVLLAGSLFYRWATEEAGATDLFWYAMRIILLVAIIIVFMMVTLKSFLTQKIIAPLEAIALANREMEKDFTGAGRVVLPDDAPDEIRSIVTSRSGMLNRIIKVSEERLQLVNFIRETFGRYLSAKVVDEILTSSDGHRIGGSRKTVTVLMSDLRGFTSLSETRDPEEMVRLLNRYLEKMSHIILQYDGIIDEIMGDAILAVFGAPDSHDNDPERTVACAIEMQNRLAELNREIQEAGHLPLEMGIGINTGTVIVGNIGSDLRMKYGIVGDTVNRASRIESNSIGGQVLIGEATFRLVKEKIRFDPPKTMMMKGMKKPLVFYNVTAIDFDGKALQLAAPMSNTTAMDIRIPVECRIIQDKKISPIPIAGTTLSIEADFITVSLPVSIPALTDVKLNIEFCLEAHCFDDIYAKCIAVAESQGRHDCRFRVTAIGYRDRALIKKWLAEGTG